MEAVVAILGVLLVVLYAFAGWRLAAQFARSRLGWVVACIVLGPVALPALAIVGPRG